MRLAELEAGGDALSTQVNEAVRVALERRRRHRLMGAMLDKLDGVHGPVDERLVRKYLLDGCLSRETWVKVRDTDRTFARYVGAVLTAAHADSTDIADAHAVAAAVEGGGGVILTGAESDISRLSASFRHVHVAPI